MAGKPTYRELERTVKKLRCELEEYRLSKEEAVETQSTVQAPLYAAPESTLLVEVKHNDTELQYTRLLEMSPDPISIHRDNKIVFINPEGVKLFGATHPSEIIGKNIIDFFHPDFRETAIKRISLINRKGKSSETVDEKIIRLDGAVIDIEASGASVRYNGRPAILSMFRDITERKELQEPLQQSEKEWEMTFNAISDWICLVDGERKILRSNIAGEKICGVPVGDITGQTCCKLLHGTNTPINGCPVERMINTGRQEWIEYQTDDGRWLSISAEPLIEKNIGQFVHIIKDITEKRETEADYIESQESYRNLVESLQEGIWKIDKNGNTVFINEPMAEMIGYS